MNLLQGAFQGFLKSGKNQKSLLSQVLNEAILWRRLVWCITSGPQLNSLPWERGTSLQNLTARTPLASADLESLWKWPVKMWGETASEDLGRGVILDRDLKPKVWTCTAPIFGPPQRKTFINLSEFTRGSLRYGEGGDGEGVIWEES